MAELQAPARRGSLVQAFLMIAALAASCAVGGYYWYSAGHGASRLADTGFDVSHVETQAPTVAYAAPAAPAASPMPIAGLPGMSAAGAQAPQQTAGAFQKSAGAAADAAPAGGPDAAELKREQEFLAKHGAQLASYEKNVLGRITRRHYLNDPVVRRVDREFGALPNYMKVKRRYDQDHNPFTFARDAIALPEVRQEIAKSLADPGVWKAALGMINEALKNPPPSAIYDEAKHFMTNDSGVTDYMANGFMPAAQQNMGAIQSAVTSDPNLDVSGLQKLAGDIAPAGSMPAMPAGLNPAALGAMAGQQPPKQ